MPELPERVIFGYPEMGPKVYSEFKPFLLVLPRLNDALNRVINAAYPNPEPHQSIILKLGELSMMSMLELVTLVGNGLGQGAFKILRSMLEYGVNAEYIRQTPAEAEDYKEWLWIDHYKHLIFMRENMPDAYKALDAELIGKAEVEYNRVKPRYEYTTRSGRTEMQGHWCKLNLADRATRTGLQAHYKIIYPLASKLFHGALSGMVMHYEPEEDPHRLAVPPSLEWCGPSLNGGHALSVEMLKTLTRALNTQSEPSCAELEQDYKKVWQN